MAFRCVYGLVVFGFLLRCVAGRQGEGQCVKLDVSSCQDLNYNTTLIPNVKMNIDEIKEAQQLVLEFSPLFKINCYENLKFFICNMYVPICHMINGNPTPVYPCRHVCEQARIGCEPLMRKYSFAWPDNLQCDFLSRKEDRGALCGSPPDVKVTETTTTVKTTKKGKIPNWVKVIEKFPRYWISSLKEPSNWLKFASLFGVQKPAGKSHMQYICENDPHSVYIKEDSKEFCPSRCDVPYPFTKADKRFSEVWLSVWSIICFLSTTLTVTTYLIDHRRFKYPERPIIFLSFCYNLYSIGYLIRVFGGYDQIICQTSNEQKHVVVEGMSVTLCTLVFFFLYFFGMASALWWVILSLTWFLSAALKWGHEAIEKYSSLFHAIAWTVPTIQTIVALVTRKVDADKLSGLCYIGNTNSKDLLLFVALPLLIYLLLGTVFLCMGFIALVKIRKILRRQRNTNKFERLMLRIGVFSVLYSVPASIVVGCFIHEYNRIKKIEQKAENVLSCMADKQCLDDITPKVELFFLRYFMLLVVGVTSGVWIWTSKTFNSWKKFYRDRCGEKEQPEEKRKLYKQQASKSSQQQQRQRRASNDALNHGSIVASTAITTLHGSSNNMSHQQVYMPPQQQQTRFFFPVTQNPSGFMHAHNLPVAQAKLDNMSRGYTVTPLSNFTSDGEEKNHFNFDANGGNILSPYSTGEELMNPPPSKSYSNSDHHSISQHSSQQNGTLSRSHRSNDQPSSPKSQSTRSHRSNEEYRL